MFSGATKATAAAAIDVIDTPDDIVAAPLPAFRITNPGELLEQAHVHTPDESLNASLPGPDINPGEVLEQAGSIFGQAFDILSKGGPSEVLSEIEDPARRIEYIMGCMSPEPSFTPEAPTNTPGLSDQLNDLLSDIANRHSGNPLSESAIKVLELLKEASGESPLAAENGPASFSPAAVHNISEQIWLKAGLSPGESLKGASREVLSQMARDGFQMLNEFVTEHRDRIPPLAFHGTTEKGLQGIVSDKGFGSERSLGYVAAVYHQASDPETFTNDLINAAKVAVKYGQDGVVVFAGNIKESPLPGAVSYLSIAKGNNDWMISESKHNKYNEVTNTLTLPGGLHATEDTVRIDSDNFGSAYLTSVLYSNTPLADQASSLNDGFASWASPEAQLISEIAGQQLLIETLSAVTERNYPPGSFSPTQCREEKNPESFQEANNGETRSYAYPDGFEIHVVPGIGVVTDRNEIPDSLRLKPL